MSDPPPTKPKVGSLRDRIAAFESKPAAPAGPAPVPRPKPAGGASWKPRAVSPAPPSEPTQASASSPPRDKKVLGGMSASDAKESIGMGGSLKERMAALQGRGAFSGPGAAPAAPPKPTTDKPKWKPPPRVMSPPPDDQATHAGDARKSTQSPPPDTQHDSTEVPSSSAEEVAATAEAEGESGVPDPEEEERQRRAAIAARMARLGGARVGMAPPIFGKKPSVKKPEIPKDEEAPAESKPAGSSDDPAITSSRAVSTPHANSGGTDEGNPSSGDSLAKSPVSMPVPAVPRRAAPPRKKVVKSPSPAPPVNVLEDRSLEASPAPMSESQGIISPHATEGVQHMADKREEVGEVGKSADPAIASESTSSKPPTSMLSEGHMVSGSPEVEKSVETETKPSDREFGTVEPEIYVGEPAASHINPPAASEHSEAEDQVADTQSVATSPPSAAGTDDGEGEHEHVSSEEEAAPTPSMPAELSEEEEEAARRKRVAEKLSQMGGVNPLAPPSPLMVAPPADEAENKGAPETQKEIVTSPVINPSSHPTQAVSDTVSSPPSTVHAPGKQASQGSGLPFPTSAATSSLGGTAPRSASIDVPEDVHREGEHPEDVASQYDAQAATGDQIEARMDEDDDENEDEHSNYSDAPLEMSSQQQGQGDEWAQSEEEDEGITAAAAARMLPPPPPPNVSTRPQPGDNVANKRTSQGPERASIPAPPTSPPKPEASTAYDVASPPSRSIPPPPVPILEDEPVSMIELAHPGEPEDGPSPPRRSMPPPPRRQTVEVPSTYVPHVPTSPPSRRSSIAPPVPAAFSLEGSDIPSRTATPPAPTSPPSRRTSVVPPVPGAFSTAAPSQYPASPPAPPARPPPRPTSPPSRRTSVVPPVPGAFSSIPPSHSQYPASPPAPPSRPPPPPTSPPSRRTSVVPPVPGAFSSAPPSHSDYPVSPPAPPSRPYEEPTNEVLDEEEGDPIDPGFHSPTKTPPSNSQPLPTPSPPPPVPGRAPELEEESEVQDYPEKARGRTIAERMAKLGGITFGGPLPAGRPSALSPLTNARPTVTDRPVSQDGQPEEVDMDEEEEERARKERIATKLSSMGGVGMFGAPPPRAAPRAREASEDTINAAQPPPPPPQRTVPPPSASLLQDSDSEFESHGISGASDDGVKVEAEDSELEEVHHEDTMDEEEAPPVVPSRAGRSNSGAPADNQSRKSVELPPPVPGSRPPVPAIVANRQSSVRKSSTDSHATPSTRRISLDPSPASAAVIPSPSDYVMAEEEEEAPPPPPSRPNRGPPTRAPPPPLAESTMGSSWEMPSSSPVGDFDGPPLDLSLSASNWSEDSTSHPTQAPSHPVNTAADPEDPPVRAPVQIPQEMSSDDLMAVWGRVGVQICEVGTTLFEKSKRTLIGDGSYLGFLRAVFSQVPNAMLPLESSEYGYLIYAQTGTAVQRRASDIMPGDVIALYDAKLKGHKGIQSYHQSVGAGEPLLGVVSDYEVKKGKVKVFHANQHVGQQTVESVSYRLEDLKSGAVKIFRVLEA